MRSHPRVTVSGLLLALSALGAVAPAPAPAQVTLSLERYEDLRARARVPEAAPRELAAPWATEDVELAIEAGDASARLVTTWHVVVFADGWQTLPFLPSGSIVAADFGAAEGRVDAGGGWSLRLRGAGRHTLRIESVIPVERDATATRPTWRFVVHVPAAAAARGTVRVLPGVETASVEGSAWIGPDAAHPGTWSLLARPASSLTLTLAGRQTTPQRALLPLRFEASGATVARVSRTEVKLDAWIEARVLQGRLETLRVPIPPGFEVARVDGSLAGWKPAGGVLTVTPLAPVEGSWPLHVELTGPPRDAFASPLLLPADAVRTSAFCAVAVRGDGLASVVDPGAARALDDGERQRLPGALRAGGERLYLVADVARPPRFAITWAEGTEVLAAQVDRLLVEVALGEAGQASYRLWVEARNRGAQQLIFTLPPGFALAAASRDQGEVRAGQNGLDFALPLAASERAQSLRLAGILPLALPASGELVVPLPRLSAPVGRVEVRVLVPPGRVAALADPTRAGVVAAPPQSTGAAPAAANAAQEIVLAPVRAVAADALFPTPPGFTEVAAAWNALSAAPQPLALRVKPRKEETSWY